MKPLQHRGVFRKLLLSYLLVLCVPIAFFSLVSMESNRMLEENAISFNMNMLEQSRSALEGRLEDIQRLMLQISADHTLTDCAVASDSGRPLDYYQIWQCIRALNDYTAANDYIAQAFMILRQRRVLVSTTSFIDLEDRYGSSVSFKGIDYGAFKKQYVERFHSGSFVRLEMSDDKAKDLDAIAYVKSFPDYVTENFYGNIVIFIDNGKIKDLLGFNKLTADSSAFILDGSNRVLAATTGSPAPRDLAKLIGDKSRGSAKAKIGEKNYIVSFIVSPDTGFKYASVFPDRQVMSQAYYVKNMLLIVLFSAIVLGLALSLLLVRSNTKPLYEIVDMLRGFSPNPEAEDENEYEHIESAVNELLRSNRGLRDMTHEQKDAIRDDTFRILLLGGFEDEGEAKGIAQRLGLGLEAELYQAALIQINKAGEAFDEGRLVNSRLLMDECARRLGEALGERFSPYRLSESSLVVLFRLTSDNEAATLEEANSLLSGMSEGLAAAYGLSLNIGIGTAYRRLTEVCLSFRESKTAAEFSNSSQYGGIVRYDELPAENGMYSYPIDDEQRLFDFLKSGNAEQIERKLDELLEENLHRRKLRGEILEQLFYAMKGTLTRAALLSADLGIREEVRGLKWRESDGERGFKDIRRTFSSLAGRLKPKKSDHAEKIVEGVKAYLAEAYSDSNLSLSLAASKFGISDVYLSTLFKARTGENFNAYLEGLRQRSAKKLLIDTDLPGIDIALSVGYHSAESFRRAFKRNEGISPSEYRNLKANAGGDLL